MLAGGMVMILAGAANISQLVDSPAMNKLVATIMATIGEAKAIDEEKRDLPPVQSPKPLLPPRPDDITADSKEREGPSSTGLDDDIPF